MVIIKNAIIYFKVACLTYSCLSTAFRCFKAKLSGSRYDAPTQKLQESQLLLTMMMIVGEWKDGLNVKLSLVKNQSL